jgi:predicted transcriptional regulator
MVQGFFAVYYLSSTPDGWRRKMAQELGSQTKVTTRRSAFETMMDVLKATAEGSAKPTHIMYRSNTSWIVLQKNLESLVTLGFVGQSGEGSRIEYAITPKGLEALHEYVSLVQRTRVAPTSEQEAFR